MHPSRALALGAALATAASASPFALPPGFHRFAPRATNITWTACGKTKQCARFEVPLDYQNATAGKASLAVARYPATKKPKLGTLFLNPGGPGGSGVDMILGNSDDLMDSAGGQYDLVSWDPRGVGLTHPRAECFSSPTAENAFWNNTIPRTGLEAHGNFTDQADLDAFYAQVPEVDRLLLELGQRCVEFSPDTLQYVGTVAGVRDMVAMHDILEGPDTPVNFWGLSYGTIVGIYFVNMFPDRVGRVVIDGVVDPVYWANRPAHELWSITPESADEALDGFIKSCVLAGPSSCAIASANATGESIRHGIRRVLDVAYDYRKAEGANAEFGSSDIRNMLFSGMYSPTRWPNLATDLKKISVFLTNWVTNSTSKRSLSLPPVSMFRRQGPSNDSDQAVDYSFQAVTCADAVDAGNVTTRMVFDELVKVTRDVSQMFGPIWGDAGFYCHRWPVRAVERYTGPWNKNLSNPILVIGNEADPVTPFISAKSVADALGDNAVLIEQDDYGHASLAMHSDCTFAALKNYFLNNTLPSADQFCGTNQVLFPGPGVTKSTLAVLSANPDQSNSLEDELNEARARSNRLFIAVIALACASGLLLFSLIASCVFGRKTKKTTPTTTIRFPHEAFDKAHDEQDHEYATPYEKPKGLGHGGYAPVQT